MKHPFSVSLSFLIILVFGLSLSGCGGGGGGGGAVTSNLVSKSGTATLTSADLDTEYHLSWKSVDFTATRSGRVEISMLRSGSSPVNDPYVRVCAYDSDPLDPIAYNDDIMSGILDSKCVFNAEVGKSYTVFFTTSGTYDYGTYSYSIKEVD